MKRVFTTMLVSMICYCALAQLSIWYNGEVVYTRAYSEIDSITFGLAGTTPSTPPTDGSAYPPEQTKEYLMDVAKRMVNQFNTADQKAVIDMAEGMYQKFKDYSWDEAGEYFEDRYDQLWETPRYMKGVATGQRAPMAVVGSYTFSFAGESAIFEADEVNRKWVYKGKSSDNSMILRCKDKNGVQCEAKFWSEGQETTYQYTWEDFHWEAPKSYASYVSEVHGYYDGEWHTFYQDDRGWYYSYYDSYYGTYRNVYVNLSNISDAYAYDANGNYYGYYDADKGQFYKKDWSNEYRVYEGTKHTVTAILPKKMHFSLKQGNTEMAHSDIQLEMVKNDHIYASLDFKLANLGWTVDTKIHSTNASFAFAFNYGEKKFFSGMANLPVYELIDKADDEYFEQWADQYADRYDELLKKIGSADAVIDLFGEVQVKANVTNFGYAYRDWMNWDKTYGSLNTKESVKKFCAIFNDNSTNGIYYNSDTKQAEVKVITTKDETDDSYYPEPVLYFPADGTSYGFVQYFNRKPFTDLQYMVEDVINAYIRMSQSLHDEVGDIHFN